MQTLILCGCLAYMTVSLTAQSWRSSMYPEIWKPTDTDTQGRFLHDFSYAGFKMGTEPIPEINNKIIDVTLPPYSADNSGKTDVTAILQQAIEDLGKAGGGGVIYLPAGEYTVSVASDKNYALLINRSKIVLRGAGTDKTFIKNTSTSFRGKRVIYLLGGNSWWNVDYHPPVALTEDVPSRSFSIQVTDVSGFNVGDPIIIRNDITPELIADYGLSEVWNTSLPPQYLCRIITRIEPSEHRIYFDIPTRTTLMTRDHARVAKTGTHLRESGIENLSIGNVDRTDITLWDPIPNGSTPDDLDFMDPEKPAYQIHGTHFIEVSCALNCWVRNVNSYRPAENKREVHFLSNALLVKYSRNVTIENCDLQKPLHRAGGGNGYMFTLSAQECLVKNCRAWRARHNYSLKSFYTQGNVFLNCYGGLSRYSTDYHMHMSAANLFDGFVSEGDYLEGMFRQGGDISGTMHCYTTTESVYWNTRGTALHPYHRFLIDSRQYGWGYVIGTSGTTNNVVTTPTAGSFSQTTWNTAPADWVEGIGNGEHLQPRSLYLDQLNRRLNPLAVVAVEKESKSLSAYVQDHRLIVRQTDGTNRTARLYTPLGSLLSEWTLQATDDEQPFPITLPPHSVVYLQVEGHPTQKIIF